MKIYSRVYEGVSVSLWVLRVYRQRAQSIEMRLGVLLKDFGKRLLLFLFLALLQMIVMFLAYSTALSFYSRLTGALLQRLSIYVTLLGIFLAVYLTLMWKELFAHQYPHYLYPAFKLLIKNLAVAFGVVSICLFFYLVLNLNTKVQIVGWKLVLFISYGVFILMMTHLLQYLWIHDLSRLGFFYKKVIFVGRGHPSFNAHSFFQDFGRTKEFFGEIEFDPQLEQWRYLDEKKAIHYHPSFEQFIFEKKIGELVLFMGEYLRSQDIESITSFCRSNGIGYYLVPDVSTLPNSKSWRRLFDFIPIISCYTTSRDRLLAISMKRLFDIVFSFIALLLFLPFGLVIALLIFFEDGGSPFYVGRRIGKDGRKIKFYKFRTMFVGAAKQKKELFAFNERKGGGPLFKLRNDPRVTKIGKFLRRTSLDEVPQFLNVLRGDLSLVGPRPHLPEEVTFYRGKDFLRLECMPGITCLPQIYDRDGLSFNAWIRLDLYYRLNWSLKIDFRIILATIAVVFGAFLPQKTKQ